MRRLSLFPIARTLTAALLLAAPLAVGCTDDDEELPLVWSPLECDPLVPEICAYPFPNRAFTAEDPSAVTGRRVAKTSTNIPTKEGAAPIDPTPFNHSDGFSPGAAMLTYLEGATLDGLATVDDIGRSLEPGSPTVIINAQTGQWVPHWAGIDMSNDDQPMRTLMLQPAVRLDDATRYIVAIRNVKNAGGSVVAPSPAFVALRDGTALESEPSVELRRELYQDIFGRLQSADQAVAKGDLQLAWDFTTASRENNTGWMLHMRDEALELVGADGPAYTIEQVDTDWETDNIAYRIFGTMTVPLYLDDPGPMPQLLFGDDGMPEPNPDQPTYEVEWELIIPQSASAENPAKLMQYGHGLLGEKEQIESGHFRSWINEYNYAIFGVDLIGMSEDDEPPIQEALGAARYEELSYMFNRMHQGVLNNLLVMRMMWKGMAEDDTYGELLDGDSRYYHGISQGGIFGGVYMALSTDVERGALGVMGQPYFVLLNRSVDFDPFFVVMSVTQPNAYDQQLVLSLIQMTWDRVEPNGYTPYITSNPLPGTQTKQVLMRAALGDHQVTTLGAHLMARTMGAVHLDTGLREVWGLSSANSPSSADAVYVEYDFGLPEDPKCNVPMDLCEDPHGEVRKLEEARQQLDHFFQTGEVVDYCTGACSFPDLSGCNGGESAEDYCEE